MRKACGLEMVGCEVALTMFTGFTGFTGFTRVLEAALLQQGCGYGSAQPARYDGSCSTSVL